MIRALLPIVIACVGACSEPDPGPSVPPPPTLPSSEAEAARASLVEHVERMTGSLEDLDPEVQAELVHPALLAEIGGPSAYADMIRELKEDFRADGITLEPIEVTTVSDLYVHGDSLYATCEYDAAMMYPGFRRLFTPSFLIAESRDGGESWFFVDGKALARDPDLIPRILPDFPLGLPLPEVREAAWD